MFFSLINKTNNAPRLNLSSMSSGRANKNKKGIVNLFEFVHQILSTLLHVVVVFLEHVHLVLKSGHLIMIYI